MRLEFVGVPIPVANVGRRLEIRPTRLVSQRLDVALQYFLVRRTDLYPACFLPEQLHSRDPVMPFEDHGSLVIDVDLRQRKTFTTPHRFGIATLSPVQAV